MARTWFTALERLVWTPTSEIIVLPARHGRQGRTTLEATVRTSSDCAPVDRDDADSARSTRRVGC
jgi:hypothetical protein